MLEEINRYKHTPVRMFTDDGEELIQLKDETWVTFKRLIQNIAPAIKGDIELVKFTIKIKRSTNEFYFSSDLTWWQKLWDWIRRAL